MAVLDRPHWETVEADLREVLRLLGRQSFAQRFYLAGGTALALQLGHRRSIDLDFFSGEDELLDRSRGEIVGRLEEHATVEGLTNFDNADLDAQPQMLLPIDWEQVKASCAAAARQLAERWLNP